MLPYLTLIFCCPFICSMPYDNAFRAMDYLMRYGYLPPPDPHTGNLASYAEYEKAVTDFQLMVGLVPTAQIDNSTLEMMNKPRCGVADKMGTNRFARRKKRYNLQGSRWYNSNLAYHISNYTHKIRRELIEESIDIAFKLWTDVANLTVTKVMSEKAADIVFVFTNGSHNDGYPFDGSGGVLAHAFFPERGGDVHFDDTEIWTLDDSEKGVDLLFTAVHELGHSLGLSHSDNFQSIMAPIYRSSITRHHQMNSDDIIAIQSLYGPKTFPFPVTTATFTEQEKDGSITEEDYNICQHPQIDGITTTQDLSTYIFKGVFYWKFVIGRTLWLMPGYPKRIDSRWREIEGGMIDTVYTTYNGSTFFFRGAKYWEYVNKKLIAANKDISERFVGLPSNIDAIYTWSGNGKTYAIKGGDYYQIKENWHVAEGYPRDMSIWQGLPYANIDAAIGFSGNTRTYFFSGGDYYRFNDRLFRIDDRYPLSTANRWFGCSNLVSKEELHNDWQWLQVANNSVFTQTYPPDILLPDLTTSSASHNACTEMPLLLAALLLLCSKM